jgi:flagellar biosynthesis/type III secretory pathway chaperone
MPLGKQTLQDLFDSLEAILVNTFRLCESLHQITRRERQSLLDSKVDDLIAITREKSEIVTEMESNEEARQVIIRELAQMLGFDSKVVNLNELIAKVDNSIDTSKVSRIQQGIITLQAEIREVNNGNYALATLNVQRLEAVQEYIVGLFTPPVYYRPTIKMPVVEAPASWGRDRLA